MFSLTQKLQERKATIEKMTFKDPQQLENWRQVLKAEYMSSEESATDEGEEVILVMPLPWRSVHLNQLLAWVDKKAMAEKTPQARRQTKRRKLGSPSCRPKPIGDVPRWATSNV